MKKTKRSKAKYPSLDPTYMPRTRKEYLDIDYLGQLSEEEKKWLDRFMNETLNASFSKDNSKNLIKSDKEKRKIYNENNARNRCVYSVAKAQGRVLDVDTKDIQDQEYYIEDDLIDAIDESSDLFDEE